LRVKLLFIVIVSRATDFTTEEITSGPVLVARREAELLRRCGQYSAYYVSKDCKLLAKADQEGA
jgi:hypothetical protein